MFENKNISWDLFDNSSVLITGGTGSFGKRFVKRLLDNANPKRVVIFSRDELKQYEMELAFNSHSNKNKLRFFIGDVRDESRLDMALSNIDFVIHAAALKHVPIAEYNPFECIHTNVLGVENVVRASMRNNVKKVIALSTDKAANPINLYGASKLAADKIIVAANNIAGRSGTRFSVVRYGNVVGSRGSVIPFFEKLISDGADHIPITDTRMTRFWITLDQGVDFVMSSFELMRGGEIFVPKIPSMKITELAHCMAPNLPQKVIGVRPGEKLHEVMITEDDARFTFELKDRYVIEPSIAFWDAEREPMAGAQVVVDGFHYASNTNDDWLSEDGLRQMIAKSNQD